jgi:hypothetical protein
MTEDQAREAGAAAERLLGDKFLAETLDEMIEINTQLAITGKDAAEREAARYAVIAIMQIRANLLAVVENWRHVLTVAQRNKANEQATG